MIIVKLSQALNQQLALNSVDDSRKNGLGSPTLLIKDSGHVPRKEMTSDIQSLAARRSRRRRSTLEAAAVLRRVTSTATRAAPSAALAAAPPPGSASAAGPRRRQCAVRSSPLHGVGGRAGAGVEMRAAQGRAR